MSDSLPFMNSTGLVTKILNKIIEAQTPPKYTQDFQAAKLGYGSGSAKPFIPLLKRIGLISSDGTPTELYKKFRNSSTRASAMATAIKTGYAPLYSISEYAHDLDTKKLKDAVIQVTGHPSDSSTVTAIVGTYNALKAFANFDETEDDLDENESEAIKPVNKILPVPSQTIPEPAAQRGMSLSYTINLNLPETKDPEVFDAIFTSLKTKLLS
ncbi:MAG: DUF5343 domain-containing protein [Alphaproteobacteria bacterium]